MIGVAPSAEQIIDTTLGILIALMFLLAFTGQVAGIQIGGRLLFVSLVTGILLYTLLSGVNGYEKSSENSGSTEPNVEHGKQKNTAKQIKPILPRITGKR